MKRAVARLRRRPLHAEHLAEGVVERLGRQRRVEPRERLAQPLFEQDLPVVLTLGAKLARRDIRAVDDRVTSPSIQESAASSTTDSVNRLKGCYPSVCV
jgi:hypothetical protein